MDELLAPFHEAHTPRAGWRVGTEAEKIGLRLADGKPVPFEGPDGIKQILLELVDRHGWAPYREHVAGPTIALTRSGASITLEPGGQLELSGAPLQTIHQTEAETSGHLAELRPISERLGIAWLGLGFSPLAKPDEPPWVPKLRYGVMREYLPTKGSMALQMMRRTATVQANYDFDSEADAIRKVRVSLALSPIVTAMFANSPFVEGRATGERTHRARVWLNVDPDRCGLLPFAWEEDFGYRDYVEWALDAPMFMVKRGHEVIRNTGQTFRSFMTDGYQGDRPVYEDWQTHLNTLFPEVRLKRTIEIRGADSQPSSTSCALPALMKGVLYDETSLTSAEKLVSSLDHATVEACRGDIADLALRATLAGRPVLEWARELLRIAQDGLTRIAHLDREGRDEGIHLAPLAALLEAGQSPADALLAAVDPERDLLPQLLQHARLT